MFVCDPEEVRSGSETLLASNALEIMTRLGVIFKGGANRLVQTPVFADLRCYL